jgi:hypothetical protein
MFYYTVESSHWPMNLEFKSTIEMKEGQCFRILRHDGFRSYPTRFKVLSISDTPTYSGTVVEVFDVDTNVEQF